MRMKKVPHDYGIFIPWMKNCRIRSRVKCLMKKVKRKTGFEPVTLWAAIKRSTTELLAHCPLPICTHQWPRHPTHRFLYTLPTITLTTNTTHIPPRPQATMGRSRLATIVSIFRRFPASPIQWLAILWQNTSHYTNRYLRGTRLLDWRLGTLEPHPLGTTHTKYSTPTNHSGTSHGNANLVQHLPLVYVSRPTTT